MKTQGRLGIAFDNQFNIGENVCSRPLPNDLNNIIPDGTRTIDTNQAIITPNAISIQLIWWDGVVVAR